MKKSVFYHAGCPVCVSAEAELLELLDQDKLEIVHLGQSQDKIPEAREHGVTHRADELRTDDVADPLRHRIEAGGGRPGQLAEQEDVGAHDQEGQDAVDPQPFREAEDLAQPVGRGPPAIGSTRLRGVGRLRSRR